MKKSIIAASASAVALAAMPALGAFADVTDTVILSIDPSCSVGGAGGSSSTAGKTITVEHAQNSQLYTYDAAAATGGTLKVSCNNASGWQVKAAGNGDDANVKTSMNASGTGTDIPTGSTFSGDSAWGFKLASGGTGVNIVEGYTTFTAIPGTATKVASGAGAISEGTIYTGYQVWVSATQQADTYTGRVTYTAAEGTN